MLSFIFPYGSPTPPPPSIRPLCILLAPLIFFLEYLPNINTSDSQRYKSGIKNTDLGGHNNYVYSDVS